MALALFLRQVEVAGVRVEHEVRLKDFTEWLNRPGRSPRDVIQQQKIRSILGMPVTRGEDMVGRGEGWNSPGIISSMGFLSKNLLRILVFCLLLGVLSLKLFVFRKLLWRQNLLQTCVLFFHELPILCLCISRLGS